MKIINNVLVETSTEHKKYSRWPFGYATNTPQKYLDVVREFGELTRATTPGLPRVEVTIRGKHARVEIDTIEGFSDRHEFSDEGRKVVAQLLMPYVKHPEYIYCSFSGNRAKAGTSIAYADRVPVKEALRIAKTLVELPYSCFVRL